MAVTCDNCGRTAVVLAIVAHRGHSWAVCAVCYVDPPLPQPTGTARRGQPAARSSRPAAPRFDALDPLQQ